MPGALFALTMALSAALVSLVQPLAGKELLPLAGGTPAVWTTCLVLFQALLLVGYAYADRVARLPARWQLPAHALTLTLAAGAGWLGRHADPNWVPTDDTNPTPGLALYLLARVGGPFIALTATAPLLSRWYSRAADPYRLYAASNAGSLLGLVSYPFLVEPSLALGAQETLFAAGFAMTAVLITACGLLAHPAPTAAPPSLTPAPNQLTRLQWLGLAVLPASLLAGVTAHVSTDVAPVPLVWVGPLALYLLSFVVVFGRWTDRAARTAGRLLPMGLTFLAVALATRAASPMLLVAGLHLSVFFLACLVCHGELARSRPPADRLTGFYLTVSAGGVLGGLVNAVIAPVVFARVGPAEYPAAVALLALVRPAGPGLALTRRDLVYVVAFTFLTALLILGVGPRWAVPLDGDAGDALLARVGRTGLLFGLPATVMFALVARPARFAACLIVLLGLAALDPGPHGRTRLTTRNFFGTLRVATSPDGRFTRLVHGTTQHGQEATGDPGRPTPLMYYHPTGPAGRVLAAAPGPNRVAAVGLGTGALAAYVRPGDAWTFYEVDPAVVRIAQDPAYFRALSTTPAPVPVVLGDARRTLAAAPDGAFDIIVLDAFNSDAVPVHLLTVEAFGLYARKLSPRGIVLAHLSNEYLDLPPAFARIAAAHSPAFLTWADDDTPSDADRLAGKTRSIWAITARDRADLPTKGPRWQPVRPPPGRAWRDDFADLVSAWKRGE